MAATASDRRARTRRLAAAGAVTFIATALAPSAAHADTPAVRCIYTFNTWLGGFTADVKIVNNGPAINGWTIHWTFAIPTDELTAWSTNLTVLNRTDATATNASWNAPISTGGSVSFGWNAMAVATSIPTDLTINGMPC
jgi:Cellulose binding domain